MPTLSPPTYSEPAWARSLNVNERLGLALPAAAGAPTAEPDRALRRLDKWRQAHGLDTGGGWAARLAGTTESDLLALLRESADLLAARAGAVPEWVSTVERVLARDERPEAGAETDWRRGFALVVAPFVRDAIERLRARCPHAASTLIHDVANTLSSALVILAARTLVLELNVLRVQGQLAGDTPAERFWSFVERFTTRPAQDQLFGEYPVLARMLVQRADQTVEAAAELIERWATDRAEVAATVFGGEDPGEIVSAAFDAGDGHQGGRAVVLVRFTGGERLVYKPRSLAVHARFNDLLAWLDGATGLGLRRLRLVDRDGYGWVEFAEAEGCPDAEAVERYYRRMGALLALLYAIDGSDFHYENLVAAGDQPVLVDLEALFHPRMATPSGPYAEDPAQAVVAKSVMRSGILPTIVSTQDGAVDLGGLGGDQGGLFPIASPSWESAGTDQMRMERRNLEFPGGKNRPTRDGVAADPASYVESLVAGFRVGYDAIAAGVEELTGPGGLLESFEDIEVRAVVRATRVYGTVLYEGTHPDLLRDALDRDRHFDFMWSISAGDDMLTALVPHEIVDMWAGDVPIFTARPARRDLWTSRGVHLPDLLAESPMERVLSKLAGLGTLDRQRQEWFIRASLVTRPRTTDVMAAHPRLAPAAVEGTGPGRAELVAAARAVGDRLAELAIRRDGRVNWLGLDLTDALNGRWQVNPLRCDLFSGFPGLGVFFARLGQVTGERRFSDLARDAMWSIPNFLVEYDKKPDHIKPQLFGVGGFNGLGGLAYAALHIATATGDQALLDIVERSVRLAEPVLDGDELLDVVGGSAGAIGALLAVHSATGLPEARALAIRCGERLLDHALPQEHGLAWPSIIATSAPLTGFSHGTAGIGWALIRLGEATGQSRFVEAGLAAFAYEHAEFRPEWGNWPDYRIEDGDPDAPVSHMHAWCHGAPGVGLARAALPAGARSERTDTDLDRAIRSTLSAGFGGNHSLCHGDLGNAELLVVAGTPTGHVAAHVLESLAATGPRCGTPYRVETPGLMTGLAGIGYGLLRLADPATPSVLLFEPPAEVRR